MGTNAILCWCMALIKKKAFFIIFITVILNSVKRIKTSDSCLKRKVVVFYSCRITVVTVSFNIISEKCWTVKSCVELLSIYFHFKFCCSGNSKPHVCTEAAVNVSHLQQCWIMDKMTIKFCFFITCSNTFEVAFFLLCRMLNLSLLTSFYSINFLSQINLVYWVQNFTGIFFSLLIFTVVYKSTHTHTSSSKGEDNQAL